MSDAASSTTAQGCTTPTLSAELQQLLTRYHTYDAAQREAYEKRTRYDGVVRAQRKNMVETARVMLGLTVQQPALLDTAVHATDHTFISTLRAYGGNVMPASVLDGELCGFDDRVAEFFATHPEEAAAAAAKAATQCNADRVWVVVQRTPGPGEWDSGSLMWASAPW
jgi:hypothetical protein